MKNTSVGQTRRSRLQYGEIMSIAILWQLFRARFKEAHSCPVKWRIALEGGQSKKKTHKE